MCVKRNVVDGSNRIWHEDCGRATRARALRLRLLFSLAALTFAASAIAQMIPRPPPHLLSVELLASRSTVFTAEVIRADWRSATLAVRKRVKGKVDDRLIVEFDQSKTIVDRWTRPGTLLLVTDPQPVREHVKPPTAPALQVFHVSEVLDLSTPDVRVLTEDLRMVEGPTEILRAITEAIRKTKGSSPAKSFAQPLRPARFVEMPPATRAWLETFKYLVFLDVPLDAGLEAYGQREVRSTDPDRRLDAVHALSNFHTSTSELLLRERLSDDGWRPVYSADQNQIRRVEVNDVRAEAFRALEAYGKWTSPPETERPKEDRGQIVALQRFGGGPFYGFSEYPNLEVLDLSCAPLSENQCANIGQAFSLKALFFEGSSVTDTAMAKLVGDRNQAYGLRYLETVDVAFTAVTDAGMMEFTRIPTLKQLFVGHHATPAGLAAARKARPDLRIEPDPFAFLEPFRPRRVPQSYGRMYGLYWRSDRAVAQVREFALIFPKETADDALAALKREMEIRGWSHWDGGYSQGRESRVFTQYDAGALEGVVLAPGERFILVHWNSANL